ncbi:MAG TPA: protein kinase [Candidatus Dormibacteraeota bacterium]|nr:protein kinase [Candidatus Dormibacteraeota bacterium]
MIGQTLGHYRITEKLGAGGMGVVYRARDERLERDVALKVLPAGALRDDAARRQFRKEALVLAKLNHPNIETVYEFDTEDGIDFLVMEYVPGKTLADRLSSGALPEKEVIALGMQIAAALEDAHERGIVHRDLKPANIAMTAKGHVKVLDFGLAKLLRPVSQATTDNLTDTQAAAGTLPYMSPEQLGGESADARTDIYSAGVVLYEMTTKCRPFEEELASRLIDAILHRPPVPPRALNPRISLDLERIILKCLDKEPGHRYQSAKELSVDLQRMVGTSTASIIAPSTATSPWRHPAVGYAATGLLVLAAAIAFNLGGWRDRLMRTPSLHVRSLAVLPMQNRSGDPDQEYFADGVTEALITNLAQIGELRVISRTSAMHYKGSKKTLPEIARELNVDAVVEVSAQRSGDRVQINAHLIHAPTDRHLWAASYERDLRNILPLQAEVASAIAKGIQIKLTAQERARLTKTHDVPPEAHEAYLLGRYYWNKRTKEGLQKSIKYLEQATAKDPTYALAYAALTDSYNLLPDLTDTPTSEAYSKARAAAQRALEIDDSLAEAHTALANVKEDYEWDWIGAEQEYKRAIELNPGYEVAHAWYSDLLLELGRLPEALVEAKKAQELDPLSVFINGNLGAVLCFAGKYAEAVEQCKRTLEIDPMSHRAHRHLGRVYLQKRLYSEAVAEYRKAIDLSGGSAEYLAELGHTFGRWGKRPEAEQILEALKDISRHSHVSPYHLAVLYAGLDENELALKSLQKAVEDRSPGVVLLKVSPLFEHLRPEGRFQDLLRRIGLSK